VSYILDALKKAAEQRGPHATALLRAPAPLARAARLGRLPWIVAGVLLLLNVIGLVYLLRPAAVVTPAPPPVTPPRVTLIQPIEPPLAPPPTQVIPAEPPRPVGAITTPPATAPITPAATTPTKPAAEKPVADKAVARVPTGTSPPVTPRAETSAKLKLEVLSYSDVPAQRLVFINGRRYREGDTIDGTTKIEEIREDGVVLSEDGRRFTLR
jgi:general secretion pathway protein B